MTEMTARYEVTILLLHPFYCSGNYSKIVTSVLGILIKYIEQSDIMVSNDLEGSFPDRINKCGDPTYNRRSCKELENDSGCAETRHRELKINFPKNGMRGKSLLIQDFVSYWQKVCL